MEGGGMNRGKEVIRNDRNTKLASSSASVVDKKPLYRYDAQLLSNFEQSGEYFNYNASVSSVRDSRASSDEDVRVYLSKIQRGGLIQPFGCMITVELSTLTVVAYSENCCKMLGLDPQSGSLVGVDAGTLFAADIVDELAKVAITKDPSRSNPLCVNFRNNSFYAILQSIDAGIMIDLEPAPTTPPIEVWSETVKSQNDVMSVITQLQSEAEGDISGLCDILVQEMQNLLDYDRVMMYKFHEEDDHGEVVSEVRKSEMESYSGLHYPATDIPQAARFLFQQNRIRMICDCKARPVRIIQSETLPKPVALVASSLRAAHDCHNRYMANMGSIASLVLAIIVNQGPAPRLWGLAVCHHRKPKYIYYPVRQGLQLLMNAFCIKLQTELNLTAQEDAKRILKMQTMLCDMLQRRSPFSIINQSPNIMDLVKCDGAAMVYGGKCFLLGVTPTQSQLMDIVYWLLRNHEGSSGVSTDSLVEAGYPGAFLLGEAVCGMACVRIATFDFLFWFRSHAAREIRWGGAVQRPGERDDIQIQTMHPRSSFTAFLQVIKNKSLAWDTAEVNAIHSLQRIMRASPQQLDSEKFRESEARSVADNAVRAIKSAHAPIFGVDKTGFINGWNSKMVELTGLQESQAFGKSLIDDILHEDSRGVCECFILSKAMHGEELQNIEIKLQNFQTQASNAAVYLVVNACATKDYENNILGSCFIGQDRTTEKVVQDNFVRLQGDYEAIVHSPNPLIPPIFACDENAYCTEWSTAMERLTGLMRHEVIGKTLTEEIFGHLCMLKDQDSLTKFMIMLHRAIGGQDIENLPFGFYDQKGKFVEVFITANKRVNEHGAMVGCLCFLQAADEHLSLVSPQQEAESSTVRDKEVAYLCQELKNPLKGLQYATNKLLQETAVSVDQKNHLDSSNACARQLMSFLEDINNLGRSVEGSERGLECEKVNLGAVFAAVISQVMTLLEAKHIQLMSDIPDETKALVLFGDGLSLQMALSDLLNSIAKHTPCDGWIEIKAYPGLKLMHGQYEYIHQQISFIHSGEGIPSDFIKEMCGERSECTGEDGMALNICYKRMVTLMNGQLIYIREDGKCFFQVQLQLPTPNKKIRDQ